MMLMPRMRQLLLIIALLGALPIATRAQWATHYPEHDWRVSIGGNSYGLQQEFFSTVSLTLGTHTTTIYFGRHTFRTALPAVWVVTLAAVAIGIVCLAPFAIRTRKPGPCLLGARKNPAGI